MNINTDRGGPRQRQRRPIVAADAPAAALAVIDCTDCDVSLVACSFEGAARQVTVQLEAELEKEETERFLLGAAFPLTNMNGLGQMQRLVHGGAVLRARIISMEPQAVGRGTPSPLQSRAALGYTPVAVGGRATVDANDNTTSAGFFYYVVDGGTPKRLIAYNAQWTQQWAVNLDAANTNPVACWAGDDRVLVADATANKLFAYAPANGAYTTAQDITLHADNADACGVWANGVTATSTVWVADTDKTLYAYTLGSGARDGDKDITLAADHTTPADIASDGTILYALDGTTVRAYTLDGGARQPDLDFVLSEAGANWAVAAAHTAPVGLALINEETFLIGDTAGALYGYGAKEGQAVLHVKSGPRLVS